MRILIDTDVLIDIALRRPGFFEASAGVMHWAEDNPGDAAVAWHTLSNIAYLVRPNVRPFLNSLLEFAEVAEGGTRYVRQALGFPMPDFEDAMQAAAALAFDAQFIVTRNLAQYRKSPIPALSPRQFLKEVGRAPDQERRPE